MAHTVVTGKCSWCGERVLSSAQEDGSIVYGCEFTCLNPAGKRSPKDPGTARTIQPWDPDYQKARERHGRGKPYSGPVKQPEFS